MSANSVDPTETNRLGPDLFGFYASEVAELLSQDESLLPFAQQMSHLAGNLHEVGKKKGSTKNSFRTDETNSINGSALPFSLLSEFKVERLRSLLRQSVFTLTHEVDEMINPVLSVCRIRACLKHKESLLSMNTQSPPHKKLKGLPACSDSDNEHVKQDKNGSARNSSTETGKENVVIDDDLRFILENDSIRVQELMMEHSGELSATLNHMEKKLEELLNTVMASCRPMTIVEKQQLRKWIQNLPPKNLDRVVDIIGHNKPTERHSCDEVHVDLDGEDKVTLWRLYFYVRAIKGSMQ